MRLDEPGERDPLGDHLQRADHRRPDPAGAARRRLPPDERGRAAAAQPAIYGLGGIVAPFIGIKAIDLVLTAVGLT